MDTGVTTMTKNKGRKRPQVKNLPSIDPPALPKVLWVFELEDDGTVIYSRPHLFDAIDELEGHNFFDKGLGFEDITKCRHHFQSFIKSNKAAASFVWRCSSSAGSVDTKVLMTRAFQTGSYPPTGVVLMEIRGC